MYFHQSPIVTNEEAMYMLGFVKDAIDYNFNKAVSKIL